jgi:high-affinity nickel-transport protein
MRHATDPDHVVAVTTIISRERSTRRAALVGAFWGLGHTVTIFVVGTGIILFDIVIPVRLGLSMELCVGLMLIALGLWNVATFRQSIPVISEDGPGGVGLTHSHSHGHGGFMHTHEHTHRLESNVKSHAPMSDPLIQGKREPGAGNNFSRFVRPLFVGIVHGLAGSAAVALLILASIRNSTWAIVYLLVFGIGTIAGMVLITTAIAAGLRLAGSHIGRFSQRLGLATGLISVAFGCFVAYHICVAQGLFSSHPSWVPN